MLDTDWDSIVWRSPDDRLMARVLAAWDEHLAHRDLRAGCPSSCARGRLRARGGVGGAAAERRLATPTATAA